MPMLISSYPSPTATISRCPQCRAVANISLIEPDLEPLKERRTFACEECGSSYIYLIDRTAPAAGRHQRARPGARLVLSCCLTISELTTVGFRRMSAFGPKRTSPVAPHMFAFGGEADMTFLGRECLL
jgi:predicted RNA-binding Zn-ribbon protein involved in translation (DUF1610 family)